MPQGFLWGAVKAGIKASGNPDLAVAVAPKGATAAAMYTKNRVVAAPVTIGRRHLAATGGRVSAVVVNAGNANCATGEAGLEGCVKTCIAAAEEFQCIFDEVFPSSTGIIGVPFPADKVVAALPAVRASLGSGAENAEAFATAILTTDTKKKVARAVIDVDGTEVRIFGVCKGAGMIHPAAWDAGRSQGATACNDAGLPVYRCGGGGGAAARDDDGRSGGQLQLDLDRWRYFDERYRAFAGERGEWRKADGAGGGGVLKAH